MKTQMQMWNRPRPLQRWRRLVPFQQHHKNRHHEYTKGMGWCLHHFTCGRIMFTSSLVETHCTAGGIYLCFSFLEGDSFPLRSWNGWRLHLFASWWLEQGCVTQAWPIGALILDFVSGGSVVEAKGHLRKVLRQQCCWAVREVASVLVLAAMP